MTEPGSDRTRGPVPAPSRAGPAAAAPSAAGPSHPPGPTPEQVRRWAAEQELLLRRNDAATSGRVRVAIWLGFIVACVAVIVTCVVAIVGVGGDTTMRTGSPTATSSSSPPH